MARICLLFVIAVVLTCVSERCCAIDEEEYYLGEYDNKDDDNYDDNYDNNDYDYDYSGKKCCKGPDHLESTIFEIVD